MDFLEKKKKKNEPPEPQTQNPKPQTLNPSPQIPNPISINPRPYVPKLGQGPDPSRASPSSSYKAQHLPRPPRALLGPHNLCKVSGPPASYSKTQAFNFQGFPPPLASEGSQEFLSACVSLIVYTNPRDPGVEAGQGLRYPYRRCSNPFLSEVPTLESALCGGVTRSEHQTWGRKRTRKPRLLGVFGGRNPKP